MTETKTNPRNKRRQNAKRTVNRLPKGPRGGIQLLLIQAVEHLGNEGDVVEVRPGFANNYLIPQGLATIATDHHKRMVEKHRERLRAIDKARQASLRALAEDLAKESLNIEVKANEQGHLYGSVGAPEICNALKTRNFSIAQDQVRLQGPLKELGLYTVKIHLGRDVDSEIKVWVVPSVTEE